MSFWIYWEQGFQAFMVLIGVSLLWLRFIEPLFASRGFSLTLIMIIISVALAALKFYLGVSKIRRELDHAQKQIDATLAGKDAS
jgi:hypothetical protein